MGLASELAAKKPIETDGDDNAADDGGELQVGRLSERIERRQQEKTCQTSRNAAGDDFQDNPNASFRTTVSFGQVAMA